MDELVDTEGLVVDVVDVDEVVEVIEGTGLGAFIDLTSFAAEFFFTVFLTTTALAEDLIGGFTGDLASVLSELTELAAIGTKCTVAAKPIELTESVKTTEPIESRPIEFGARALT